VQEDGDVFRCQTQGGQVVHTSKQVSLNGGFQFYGVRPSKIVILKGPPQNSFANVLKGWIRESSYLGSTQNWLVTVGDDETWMVSQSLYQNQPSDFSIRDEVYLCWGCESGMLLS
jgi:hypothetical protein